MNLPPVPALPKEPPDTPGHSANTHFERARILLYHHSHRVGQRAVLLAEIDQHRKRDPMAEDVRFEMEAKAHALLLDIKRLNARIDQERERGRRQSKLDYARKKRATEQTDEIERSI